MALTDNEIFNRYFNGGNYALPFLLKFSCPGCNSLYFVNNTEDIVFEGKRYIRAGFEYMPPDSTGNGASLRIGGNGTGLVEFIENADENYRLDVIGLIAEGGEVQKLKQYVHFYGSVSYTENMELNFELGTDDRLDMTFPPYKFDAETNKGNT